ncbi:MAG: V-type ATPase 116kDa subunit family protein [Synergistes sp.]|nr:V-type ATPase 116kDa subunit family protein [Synergistes sp.]
MAVMKMSAVTMIGPHDEMEPLARRMVMSDTFQPVSLDVLVNDRSLRSQLTTETINPYDELLSKISGLWKAAGKELPEPQPVAIARDFTLSKAKMVVETAAKSVQVWSARKEALIAEEEELRAVKVLANVLSGTRFTFSDLADGHFMKLHFGFMSNDNFQRLDESAAEAQFIAEKLETIGENTWVLVITAEESDSAVNNVLNTVYFKEIPISDIAEKLPCEDPVAYAERRIADKRRAIDALERAAAQKIDDERENIELLYSQLYTMQRVYDVCKGRGEVSGMFVISGWLPEDAVSTIEKMAAEDAPNTVLIVEEAKDLSCGVRIPVKLSNCALFRSFQDIVAMYSLPSYGELDPSPIVAVMFVLFFGFMFGDVGHGLLILLGSAFMVKRGIMGRALGKVMGMASVSSMIFGVLYGSVFCKEDVFKGLWLNPMAEVNTLLAISGGLGIIVISIGLMLNMAAQYKARNYGRLLFDGEGLAGLALYWTLCALAVTAVAGISVSPAVTHLMLAGSILLLVVMLFKDMLARVLLKEKTEGSAAMSIFGIVHVLLSFLSNTASFVRLAAFALNHVGLSVAVVMLSEMVQNAPGGIFFKGLILVIGNLIIVGLEGLIVFIQTVRLEYYEFFSKFYKGGGSEFRPVSWSRSNGKVSQAA